MLVTAGIYDEDEARRIVRRLSGNEAELLPVNAALAKKARRQVKKRQESTKKQIMYIQRHMATELMQLNHDLDKLDRSLAELDTWGAE
jgi:Mg2+ and Co2+ transporter CorA